MIILPYIARPTYADFAPILPETAGERWNGPAELGTNTVVTYSFAGPGSFPTGGDHDPSFIKGYRAFTDAQEAATRQVFSMIEDFSGLRFVEVGTGGMIDLQVAIPHDSDTPVTGYANLPYMYPGLQPLASDVGMIDRDFTRPGTDGFLTLLHEIGHALGLHHTFGREDEVPRPNDFDDNSVMTYTIDRSPAEVFGSFDKAALRYLYGSSASARDLDITLTRNGVVRTVAGHEDDAVHGSFERNVIVGRGGDDMLYGNFRADRLFGGNGSDRLDGAGGADKLRGGRGSDTLLGGDGDDRLGGGAGRDRLIGADGSDRLVGGGQNDRLWGGDGNDRLIGAAGADRLGGGAGADLLIGGTGADTFVFTQADRGSSDTIRDFGRGADRIYLTSLADAFEDVTIERNANGDLTLQVADVSIRLQNSADLTLTSEDFLF